MQVRSRFSVRGELEPLYLKNHELERERTSHKRKFVTMAPSINQYSHQVQFVNSKADNRRLTSKSKAMEIASANISQGMADQITLSASDGSDSELESNHANSSAFAFLTKSKGFLVKCLICHKTKTKFNQKGDIELLTNTNNSGYNAKRHIRTIHPTHLTEFNSAWQRRIQEPSEERQSSYPVQAGLSTTRKVKKANQPSIKNHLDSSWKYQQIRTQEDLDKAILNHLIADLLPSGEVDKEAFKNFIGGLSGPLVIRSRPFMVELLKKRK
ncbi:hypothetical protein OUZ56_017671 [Daphnia magna]|uniref:BED-type domain-containing protein n=1 Tax=Daphnia magna TaxID=35525 RepID=A0ABR0ATG2_9CRUS|nr:hypothetical protein OUZ56_017671 [Daphnia magna]